MGKPPICKAKQDVACLCVFYSLLIFALLLNHLNLFCASVELFLTCLTHLLLGVDIRYKKWESGDRCTLVDMVATQEECILSLSQQIYHLTRHHYQAKAQTAYFSKLKQTLEKGEVVVHGDFSENFSFVVQDAAQGFHWDASQCTVHPFVVHWRQDGEQHHQSYCIISDDTKHSTATVHAFLRRLVPAIMNRVPGLKKIHYFSDGCGGQYKNKFNFINVCSHADDFQVQCEWNFFATSHGKGACDGIGGTVKRATYRESLRRTV